MSENTQNTEPTQASSEDLDKVKANRDEILAEKKELKGKYDSLSEQFGALNETVKSLGALVGVQEGEDVTAKAKELLEAKEKEAYDKLSDIEKLTLRLDAMEKEKNEAKLEAEKKTKEAQGLRIDEKLKTKLTELGVSDPNDVALGLDVLKVRNSISNIDGDNLIMGDGSNVGIDSLVSDFLNNNPRLIGNPANKGSGFTGGAPVDVKSLSQKEALENARKTNNYTNVISQQLDQLKGQV